VSGAGALFTLARHCTGDGTQRFGRNGAVNGGGHSSTRWRILPSVNPEPRAPRVHERPWQLVIALVGAAAGLGVFLIALGGLAMWVRLDSVGLPAERGVG